MLECAWPYTKRPAVHTFKIKYSRRYNQCISGSAVLLLKINPGDLNPEDFKPWGFSAFRDLKILLEGFHILGEGGQALVGDSA